MKDKKQKVLLSINKGVMDEYEKFLEDNYNNRSIHITFLIRQFLANEKMNKRYEEKDLML